MHAAAASAERRLVERRGDMLGTGTCLVLCGDMLGTLLNNKANGEPEGKCERESACMCVCERGVFGATAVKGVHGLWGNRREGGAWSLGQPP